MANGLRKLFRNASRYSKSALLANRIQQYQQRLKVEELEERIAPAAVVLNPGDYTAYDVTGDNTFNATDGFIALGATSTGIDSVTVADLSDGGATDTFTLNITVQDTGGAGAATIFLVTNLNIANIDLSGLDAGTTELDLIIGTGITTTEDAAGDDDQDFTVDGLSDTATVFTSAGANISAAPANTGETYTGSANQAIGNITFGATNFTGLTVETHIVTNGTGAIGTVTSTDGDVDLIGGTSTDSLIDAGQIGAIDWHGDILPGANGITWTFDNDAGSGIASLDMEGVITTAAGNFTVTTEGVGGAWDVAGLTTVGGAGNISIDVDTGATDDGVTGALGFGGLTLSSTGNFTFNGGDSGFGSTVGTGNIIQSGGGDISITTSTNGSMGNLTVGTVTNSATVDADLTIATAGTGAMGTFTAGLIQNTAVNAPGTMTFGNSGAALGNVSLAGITINGTNATGDVIIQGTTIGTIDSTAALQTAASSAGGITIDATTSIGVIGGGNVPAITSAGSGDILIDGGTTGYTGAVTLGAITTSGSGSGNITVGTTTNGGFAGAVVIADIDMDSSGDADITIAPTGTGDFSSTVTITTDIDQEADVVGSVTIGTTTGDMGNFSLGDSILMLATSANADVTIQGNVIGNVDLGDSTANTMSGGGDFSLTSTTTIGTLDLDGLLTISSTGAFSVTAGTSIGVVGGTAFTGITASGTGGATINGGTTGFTGAVSLGALTASGTGGGDILVTTGTNGSIAGTTTTGAITNSGTNDSDISIGIGTGTGDMAAFTATGLISNTGVAVNGAITIGSTNGALGALTLAGITVASTDDGGDVIFQGESIGNSTSSATIQTDGTSVAGDILFDAQGSAALGSIGTLGVTGSITSDATGGTVTIQGNDDVGNITASTGIGGVGGVVITANNGGTADTGDVGNVTATTGNLGDTTGTLVVTGASIGNIGASAGGILSGASFTANKGTGNGTIGTVTAATTTIDGSVVSDGNIGAVSAATDITGTIQSTGGAIASITSTNGDITSAATISADSITGAITVDADESGTSKGNIAAAISTNTGNIGSIDAGGNITAAITSAGSIGAITADGNLAAAITAATGFTGAIQIDDGILAAGSLVATTGNFASTIDIDTVGLAGTVQAITGNFTGLFTIDAGGVAATGVFKADAGDIDGGLTVTAGGIASGATISAGTDIDGAITATAGDIAANITAGTNIDGNIVATAGLISGTVTATSGNLTANVTAGTGDITSVVVGGNITAGTISAEDDVLSVAVTGSITGGAITADSDSDSSGNVTSVVAGGGINSTITGQNIDLVRSGGAVGDDINGTITADADIDLIDAGAASVDAAVTASAATSSSPLATFIHDGVSYAVWAFETGSTTTVDTGVTANVVFDGNANGGSPQIDITSLADSTTGTTPDIYITSKQETGAAQQFNDTDVDVNAAPILVNTFTATSSVTVGSIIFEGSGALGSFTNVTFSAVTVEGGVSGTVAPAVGETLEFGSTSGALTINVTGGGLMGDLILRGNLGGNLTINGSAGDILIGSSGLGAGGNINDGADITATGTIADIIVNGNANGSITATSIGNVNIAGNLGNAMTANEAITASTGDITSVFVGGSIGADAAQSTTITSTNGSVGSVTAVGNIGAGNGTTSITANTNITSVTSLNGTLGDGATDLTVTATTGTIGTVAGVAVDADVTAEGNITAVNATGDATGAGIGAGGSTTITSSSGNIGTVSSIDTPIAGTITATIGNIDTVTVTDGADANTTLTGANSATITAGGDVDNVAGATITGNTTATLGTTSSPVTTWAVNGATYLFDATAGPIYNYVFNGAGKTIAITIDNWDNAGSAALAASADISLTTTDTDADGTTTILDGAGFGLTNLDFDADSVTNDTNDLGTVLVEGNVTGSGINLGPDGTLVSLIVEGDVTVPVITTNVSLFSAGSVLGIDNPTAANMTSAFLHPNAGTVTIGVPADGDYIVPVGPASTGGDISVTHGDGAGAFITPIELEAGGGVNAFELEVTGGVITEISQEDNAIVTGAVTINGDLTYVIEGHDIAAFTVTGAITSTGGLNAYDIDSITVGTDGTFTGTGNDMAGTIQIFNDAGVAGSTGSTGAVDIAGSLTGSIIAATNIGAVTIGNSVTNVDGTVTQIGSFTGLLSAGGNIGTVTAQVNVGGSGLIQAGGTLGAITATTGDVTADILTGGTVGAITGNDFSGDWLFGVAAGATGVTINDRSDSLDTTPRVYTVTPGAVAVIDIDADTGLDANGLTVDQLIIFADSDTVSATASDGAPVSVDEILLLQEDGDGFGVTVSGTLGNIVAADNATALDSNTLAANFLAASNADEGTAFTADVIDDTAPTALDAEIGDDQNTDLTVSINADTAGNIIASGNVSVTADIDSLGYVVSLNGSVSGTVHTATSFGSIASSLDWSGTWESEGTGAVGGDIDNATISAAYGAAVAAGIPSWFTGGVLVEAGDVSSTLDFRTVAPTVVIDGLGTPEPTGTATGTIYVLAGDIAGDFDIFGDFGGLQVPIGSENIGNMTVAGFISRMIVPNAGGAITGLSDVDVNIGLKAIDGETIVSENNPFSQDSISVEVSGGAAGIIDNNDSTDYIIEQLDIVGLDDAGAEVDIVGDVTEINIWGDWAGDLSIEGTTSSNNDSDPPVLGDVDLINVREFGTDDGDIDGSTADLTANNFGDLFTDGDINDPTDRITDSGTLSKTSSLQTVEYNGATTQSLYLKGSKNVSAAWSSIFGKVTDIDVTSTTGKGSAALAAAGGTVDEAGFKTIMKASKNGVVGSNGANVGHVDVHGKLKVKNLIVEGSLDSVETTSALRGVAIAGDADLIKAESLQKGFVGGNVDYLSSGRIRNFDVLGNVMNFNASSISNVFVQGTTNSLFIAGNATNSQFLGSVSDATIFGRFSSSSINGEVITDRTEVI